MLSKDQEINDGMDRAFRHSGIVIELLDTPEVQRTEYISSTGFAYKAFPGLHYPRKTHLIGTAKWAQRACDALRNNGAEFPEAYQSILLSAALLHDIGHGPFSHALEDLLESMGKGSHERTAARIVLGEKSFVEYASQHPSTQGEPKFVEKILEKYGQAKSIPRILKDYGVDNHIIADILSAKDARELGKRAFLKKLLDGSLFDVDKMDYLPRDSTGANIPEGYVDPSRLLNGLRLVEADGGCHLAIPDTALRDLCRFVAARKYMFAEVYTHRTVLKHEAMLIEAVRNAEDYFKKNGVDTGFLTDDELFAHLMRANEISAELAYDIKYGRVFLYDEAYKIDSSEGETPRLKKLVEMFPRFGSEAEVGLRNELVKAIGGGVEPNCILVRMRYPPKSSDYWMKKLDIYVYRNKDPSTFEHIADIVDGKGPMHDDRAMEVYRELCKPQTSSYCSIFTRPIPGLKERVQKAAAKLLEC